MTLRHIAVLAAVGVSLPLAAQLRPRDRYAITAEQVAAKLSASFAQKGLALQADQVALPADLTASQEAPLLEIRSVGSLGALHGKRADLMSSAVKMACVNSRVCLPFYAIVTLPGGIQPNARGDKDMPMGSGTPIHQEILVKSGAHIRLLVDSGAAHIQMSVVSMECGSLRQQIKVRSADHKQVYTAEVIDAGTVRGSL